MQVWLSHLLDEIFSPFKGFDPAWALSAVCLVVTFLFLLVFRRTTQPSKIQAAKNSMQACLLEVRLFKDSPAVILAALGGLLRHNVNYFRHSFKPMLIALPVLVSLLAHLDAWFGHSPLRPNEAAVVIVTLSPEASTDMLSGLSLGAPKGILIETPPLRLRDEKMVSWGVRVTQPGYHLLHFSSPDVVAEKTLAVSESSWGRAVPDSVAAGFWNNWFYPGEPSLPSQGPIQRIAISYPDLSIGLLGWRMHWLVFFFLMSCVLGFPMGKLMHVTF